VDDRASRAGDGHRATSRARPGRADVSGQVRRLLGPLGPRRGRAASQRAASQRAAGDGLATPAAGRPPRATPYFTGRGELLEELAAHLDSRGLVVLTGIAGVGKTQLALAHVAAHRGDYQLVWWLRAELPATLIADYAALADAHQLAAPEQPLPDKVAAVRRFLQGGAGWLLVFDGARDARVIEPYVPARSRGHVLITSRDPRWDEVEPVEVGVLSRPESVGFLHRHARASDNLAAQLASELGDLPLALEQARAYLRDSGESTGEYLERLRERARMQPAGAGTPRHEHLTTLAFATSLERARRHAPAAERLLTLLAFLGPDDIPKALLRRWPRALPAELRGLASRSGVGGTLRALDALALAQAHADAATVHPRVQAAMRARLDRRGQRRWAAAAVRLLRAAFPATAADPTAWPACARLLPHALVAAGHAEELKVAREATALLLRQAAAYLQQRGELRGARKLYERSVALLEARLGPDHLQVAATVGGLAETLRELGDLAGARAAHERGLAILEGRLRPDAPDVVAALGRLAQVLHEQGDLAGALALRERVLAVHQTRRGPAHPSVAAALTSLATVLRDQGDLAGARERLERALAIRESALGPRHPSVATSLDNLGLVLRDLGDLQAARRCLERALAVREAAAGPAPADTARSLEKLGLVLRDLGDHANAQVAWERALQAREQQLGPDHLDVARSLANLGLALRGRGDLARARSCYERALWIRERRLGPDHPEVASSLESLALVLHALGDLRGAYDAYRRAVEILQARLGAGHPEVIVAQTKLDNVLHDLRGHATPRRRRPGASAS
jgi:tetratricopeptide (TPR) repeat protein